MHCPNCGNQGTGKFCAECGTPMTTSAKFCPECGFKLESLAKLCPDCGHNIGSAPSQDEEQSDTPPPSVPNDDIDSNDGSLMMLVPGMKLGHYQIERMIGRGGMGVVYKTIYTELDKPVTRAIKTIPPPSSPGISALYRT